MGLLRKSLAANLVGVCAGYREGRLLAAVAAVTLELDDSLRLSFPKRNPFEAGAEVTIHLDDRAGSELYSIELRVHRVSYKGRVLSVRGNEARVAPVAFDLFYGSRVEASYAEAGYRHPRDDRPVEGLEPSPLTRVALVDENERSNKLGVLVTRALNRPHTTVMAFLSSVEDDVFLITQKGNFKYHNLARDSHCVFALDHRAGFVFERQVDWNYTIYEARAHRIGRESPLFAPIQREFIDKNPWEEAFFSDPEVEMIHLAPRRIIQQDILCD